MRRYRHSAFLPSRRAAIHLMFVGTGTGRYVHVLPAGWDAGRGTVEFEAHFTEAGVYKSRGQFKQDGRVRVVPFVVEVE